MSKLQYNTNAVTDLAIVDKDTMTGKIGQDRVEFRRRLSGWRVHFGITINGISLHDSEATEDCKTAFEGLMQRAWNEKEEAQYIVRRTTLPALNKFITIL